MDEMRLKALYRQHTESVDLASEDDLLSVISRSSWSAEEETALDRVAASAISADVARVLAELEADVVDLSRAVNQARVVTRSAWRSMMKQTMSLAASVSAVAVLIALAYGTRDTGSVAAGLAESDRSDVIMSMSFESSDAALVQHSKAKDDAIFNGNFDS